MTDLITESPCWLCAFDHSSDSCPDVRPNRLMRWLYLHLAI